MLKVRSLSAALMLSAVALGTTLSHATEPSVMAAEIVEYRLEKWKTAHAEGDVKVEELVGTLKKLRCEVKVGDHGGHSDVNYRCPKWQQLELTSHDDAHKWQSWLKKHGFETKHAH